ncbi:diguanylate cyclase, partial [bacterium]
RYLEEIIEVEFDKAKRYGSPLSVIMLDIDYFKSINDAYGHQFGDLVLFQLAGQLKKKLRRYDVIIRYGGEEFVILSPITDRSTAMILAQRLLESLNLHSFGNRKQKVRLKLSFAVVSYPESRVVKGIDLLEHADKILNYAKESGGNRVYSYLDMKKGKAPPGARNGKEPAGAKYLREKIDKLNKRANQSLIESIFAFAKTIELKDKHTGRHVELTVKYATDVAKKLKLSVREIDNIRQASILHDLGKIGISEKILLKKAKLTKEEFEEIKKHPQIGVDIIRPLHFLHDIIPLILYHHERWDGSGYPHGLKGEDIPIGARIIAVADAYQALTSNRPYHKAYLKRRALQIIRQESGTHFDPLVAKVFLEILSK